LACDHAAFYRKRDLARIFAQAPRRLNTELVVFVSQGIFMSHDSVPAWIETCETAARAGGAELLAWRGRFQTREKGAADLVTDADVASQRAIQAIIASRYPDHAFIGEELGANGTTPDPDRFAWIVDPLDGTTNYVHGYPNYAVSVALAQGSRLLVGVIYDPLRDECYTAGEGHGAWCNGTRLHTTDARDLANALVAVSLPARVQRDSPDLLDFVEVVQKSQAVRRTGSAAINLAQVASGALDAFWATHIHPWDVAAGVLLIQEAGGVVSGRDGGTFDLWDPHFVAAAGEELRRDLLQVLRPFARGRVNSR
jgi:myo-inositol-1(or 4)-monophosphatase